MNNKRYLTVRELAKDADCPLSEYMIRRLIDEGKLPHIKAGHKYLIDRVAFVEWLQSQK